MAYILKLYGSKNLIQHNLASAGLFSQLQGQLTFRMPTAQGCFDLQDSVEATVCT